MKLTVFTETTLKVVDFKKIIGILQESKCPNESLSNTLGDRYKLIKYPNKNTVVVYLDSKSAKTHKYDWEY